MMPNKMPKKKNYYPSRWQDFPEQAMRFEAGVWEDDAGATGVYLLFEQAGEIGTRYSVFPEAAERIIQCIQVALDEELDG